MTELTPKELENIGLNRYLRQNGRYFKSMGILLGALIIGAALDVGLKGIIVQEARVTLLLLFFIGGLVWFSKVAVVDASKAGKKFREQYEREHTVGVPHD